jgi:hypothetical protein
MEVNLGSVFSLSESVGSGCPFGASGSGMSRGVFQLAPGRREGMLLAWCERGEFTCC